MSSFICGPSHFNKIEAGLKEYLLKDDYACGYQIGQLFPALYGRETLHSDKERLIRDITDELRKLNVLCVSLQYKSHYVGTLDKEIEDQTFTLLKGRRAVSPPNQYQLFKALNCLNYQIETEHLEEIRSLDDQEKLAMAFLKEVKYKLAYDIATDTPEYESAEWEIS